jgi:O-antigen/teichoic acid export membrane protein
MITTGQQTFAAVAQAISTLVFLLAAFVLTHFWGYVGTAVAVTLARSIINIWMILAAQRRLGIRSFVL